MALSEDQIVLEIIKANATAVYKDSAQPSLRVLGKALAQCASLFTTPVGRMAEIFEKNLHMYIDKLEGLKEGELISPNTRILVPILEKMRYIDDEKVADYYAEILAMASKKDHADKVMLTFIEILNRVTSDEIKILEYIYSSNNETKFPEATEDDFKKYGIAPGTKSLHLNGSLPVLNIKKITEGQTGYVTLVKNLSTLRIKVDLDDPINIEFYIDNLISLGLLEKRYSFRYSFEKIYYELENDPMIQQIKAAAQTGETIELDHGRIDITSLGNKLLELCAKNIS